MIDVLTINRNMKNKSMKYQGWQVKSYQLEDDCLELRFKQGSLIFNGKSKLQASFPINADDFDVLMCATVCHFGELQADVISIELKTEKDQIVNLIFKDIYKDGIVFDGE